MQQLPQNQTSVHCPEDTTYYICQIGSYVFPRSIEYKRYCDFYYCCNHLKYVTTTDAAQSTELSTYDEIFTIGDPLAGQTSEGIIHITDKIQFDFETTFTTPIDHKTDTTKRSTAEQRESFGTSLPGTTSPILESTTQMASGSTNNFNITLNEMVYFFFLFIYKFLFEELNV